MAQIHTLDVPISKEPTWLWDTLGKWIKNINQIVKNGNSIQFYLIRFTFNYVVVTESEIDAADILRIAQRDRLRIG